MPLLRVVSHKALRDSLMSQYVDPLYARIKDQLDFASLADAMAGLSPAGGLPSMLFPAVPAVIKTDVVGSVYIISCFDERICRVKLF